MNSSELKRAKRAIRAEVRAARDALAAAERAQRSAAIAERALELDEMGEARVVLGFWSFGSEVDTAPLMGVLLERGRSVALPRIAGGELEPRTYVPGDPLAATSFGAFEPADGRVLDPATIDVVVTPGVAFDRMGRRVGYGGGFYDRFLPRLRPDALRLGLAFDLQIVTGVLPGGGFDLRVDAIVTESEVIRCPPVT
jgi:5-formyltetrahydrofolate cyclo-ligase